MSHPTKTTPPSGLLETLQRYVRSQLNLRSISILLLMFIGCIALFTARRQSLKMVPDGHLPWITQEQLADFMGNPAKQLDNAKDDNTSQAPNPTSTTDAPLSVAEDQPPATNPNPNPNANPNANPNRLLLVYYAITEVTVDVAFPFAYGTLLGVLLWLSFGQQGRWTLLLPLATAMCDLVENSTMVWLALSFAFSPTDHPPSVPAWATWPTSIKWGFAGLTLLMLGLGLIKKLFGGRNSTTNEAC